jgi:hypothetical protein
MIHETVLRGRCENTRDTSVVSKRNNPNVGEKARKEVLGPANSFLSPGVSPVTAQAVNEDDTREAISERSALPGSTNSALMGAVPG